MNNRQRMVVLVGIAIIALMLVVPPWRARYKPQEKVSDRRGRRAETTTAQHWQDSRLPPFLTSYSLILSPPDGAEIDTNRLLVQVLLVFVLSGGAAFALQRRPA